MKKSLVSALTTALVVGAASTTFAAANPFSDVPADHWAYDAIAQLAAEGVVEGYGDGSYRGEQEITRYEMAQMVAKAMAKGVSSATLDKLAAEFADELNQLGVRVAALEKKVDNVKWAGQLRYRYARKHTNEQRHKGNTNELKFRIEPSATVNNHWTVKSRMDYTGDTKTSADVDKVVVDRIYAEGKYNFGTIQLGKFNVKTNADFGLVNNDTMTGISVEAGKKIKVKAVAARYNYNNGGITPNGIKFANNAAAGTLGHKDATGDVLGLEVYGKASKLSYGVGYMQANISNAQNVAAVKEDKMRVVYGGLGYRFNKSVALEAAYARNTKETFEAGSAARQRMAFNLKYKGSDKAKVGSYGLWAGYLNIGNASGLYSTYRADNGGMVDDFRGWEIGGQVTLAKNIQAQLRYNWGNQVSNSADYSAVFSEVNFWF